MGYINRAGVEWTDASWDPVGGCSRASPGCFNCYAETTAGTSQVTHQIALYLGVTDWVRGRPRFNGHLTELEPGHPSWSWPLRWRGAPNPVLGPGQPSLLFVGNMADLFHEKRSVAVIDRVVDTVAMSRHVGLFLTRRARRATDYFSEPRPAEWQRKLWVGFSAENQTWFDRRWDSMRRLAEAGWTTFVSVAPMIGPVRLPNDLLDHGDRVWVIASGEQGTGARHMDPDWARALRDQCREAGVPFFFKQMTKLGPIPADLFVRQFPRRSMSDGEES